MLIKLKNMPSHKIWYNNCFEPLNRAEANTIIAVSEGAEIVRSLNHPNIKLLADIILHTHIANPDGLRCPMSEEEFDYRSVKKAFEDAGYDLRMSIEPATTDDFVESVTKSLEFLKTIF